MSSLDDDHALDLIELKRICLVKYEKCESVLRDMYLARERSRLTKIEQKLLAQERNIAIAKKGQALHDYKKSKRTLEQYRRELAVAERDVERETTDPEVMIASLMKLAIAAEAWKVEGGQDIINAAVTWLGPGGAS